LNRDYETELDRIAGALNSLSTAASNIVVRRFAGLASFAEQVAEIERQEAA